LYGIIQIKISEPHLHSVCQNLSLDIKHLANSILDVAENASQKYDNLKYTQFIDVLKGFRIEDQIEFIEYILRLFRKSSFENDIQKFQSELVRLKITKSKKQLLKGNLLEMFKIAYLFPQKGVLQLFSTILFLPFIYIIILLPTPFNWTLLNFKIQYQNISNNYLINHFLNVIGDLCGVNENFEVIPLNSLTMSLFILGKLLFLIVFINLTIVKLTEYFNRI